MKFSVTNPNHAYFSVKEKRMRIRIPYIGLLLQLFISVLFAQEKLYVFYPSTARPQAIQDKMQENFPGVTVTVFGRFNDFTTKIDLEPPDAILTKPALVKQLANYSPAVQGSRDGKTVETYVLLSINGPVDLSTVNAETVIGVFDILGRAGMNTFANQFFPTVPKLKRVTKVEDLLPLLTFNMAAAILIEDATVSFFKSTSNLTFSITPLPATTDGIAALGIRTGCKADKSAASLKKADKETSSFFKVDLWK